jgi:serine/threonine protein kinase
MKEGWTRKEGKEEKGRGGRGRKEKGTPSNFSGEPPFYDLDPTEAIEAIADAVQNDIRLQETASPEAIEFVGQCLTHNPDERATAARLLQVWQSL